MAEEKKLLEIQNLRKYFPIKGVKGPGVQAVQDVSLFIKKGENSPYNNSNGKEYIFI